MLRAYSGIARTYKRKQDAMRGSGLSGELSCSKTVCASCFYKRHRTADRYPGATVVVTFTAVHLRALETLDASRSCKVPAQNICKRKYAKTCQFYHINAACTLPK